MELFRVNGLSSEDLMRRDGNGRSAGSFLGTMFRMGPPATQPEETIPEEGDQANLPEVWTAELLGKVKKEQVVDIAASFGVADLKQPKDKLIEQILEKQG